jgi:hypothetical protein
VRENGFHADTLSPLMHLLQLSEKTPEKVRYYREAEIKVRMGGMRLHPHIPVY